MSFEPNLSLESQYSQAQLDKPEVLPPLEQPIDIGTEVIAGCVTSICDEASQKKEFEDLIYLPGTDKFYLITEEGASRLKVAEDSLSAMVIDAKDSEKYAGLGKAGLLDGFISADLSSFLTDETEKNKFLEARRAIAKPEDAAKEWILENKVTHREAWPSYLASLKKAYQSLESDAVAKAEKLGYNYSNGNLYSPREEKIKAQVKRYITARAAFAGKKEETPTEQLEALKQTVQQLKEFVTKTTYHVQQAAKYALLNSEAKLAKKQKQLPELIASIEVLAMYGIATPEFALAEVEGGGHATLAAYYAYLKKAAEQKKRIQSKFHDLDTSTNKSAFSNVFDSGNSYASMLPKSIFEQDLKIVDELELEAAKIRLVAQKNVLAYERPMYLLWDTEYKPKPLSKLSTGKFPMREYITLEKKAESETQLRYLTVTQIPQSNALDPSALKSKSLTKAPSFMAGAAPGDALVELLGVHIKPLNIDKEWFDEQGVFLPERFYDALKEDNIVVKKLEGDISAWESGIKEVLYSKQLKKRLDPFDSSPQAQIFRLVTSNKLSSDLPQALNLNIADFNKVTIAKIEAQSELSLMRGELNLFKKMTGNDYLYFPSKDSIEKVKLEPLKLRYEDKVDGNKTVNFYNGALQLRFYAKAWGFVGACLSFSPEVSLSRTSDEGTTLSTAGYKKISEEGLLDIDSINAFVSAEAGIELGCFVDWHLPDAIPAFVTNSKAEQKPIISLIKAAVKAEVKAGVKFPIRFWMKSGKPHLSVAVGPPGASISFEGEIDPSALGIWVTQFQRMLRAVKYQKIEPIADKESFQFMTDLSQAMLYTQLDIGRFLAYGKDKLDAMLSFFGKSKRAGMVAHIFNASDQKVLQEWVTLLPPEALGPLLDTLVSKPQALDEKIGSTESNSYTLIQVHAWQQMAIAKIIRWLYDDTMGKCSLVVNKAHASQRQLEEALVRMNTEGQVALIHPSLKEQQLKVNRERLEDFMSVHNFPEFDKDKQKYMFLKIEHFKETKEYSTQMENLLMHKFG